MDRSITVAALGTDPRSAIWAPGDTTPYRQYESITLIGEGQDAWDRAARDVLIWAVKTRSGFIVDDARPVVDGRVVTVTPRWLGRVVREPVQVNAVVQTATRVGFSYRTLPGHPVAGEEAFIVHRVGDEVYFTLRSLTAPAPQQPWRVLCPLLRVAQVVVRRRYRRGLR